MSSANSFSISGGVQMSTHVVCGASNLFEAQHTTCDACATLCHAANLILGTLSIKTNKKNAVKKSCTTGSWVLQGYALATSQSVSTALGVPWLLFSMPWAGRSGETAISLKRGILPHTKPHEPGRAQPLKAVAQTCAIFASANAHRSMCPLGASYSDLYKWLF